MFAMNAEKLFRLLWERNKKIGDRQRWDDLWFRTISPIEMQNLFQATAGAITLLKSMGQIIPPPRIPDASTPRLCIDPIGGFS
jgi:hypothetical protein